MIIRKSGLAAHGVAALACCAVASATVALASEPTGAVPASAPETLNEVMSLKASEITQVSFIDEGSGMTSVAFEASGGHYVLDLDWHSVRGDSYQVLHDTPEGLIQVPPKPVQTVRGTVRNVPGASVAGDIHDGGVIARIVLPDDVIWIEPIGDRLEDALPDVHVVYREADIIKPEGVCGAEAVGVHMMDFADGDDHTAMASGGEVLVADLAADADFFYYSFWGANTEQRIESIINLVNQQYEAQTLIKHVVTTISVRTSQVYTTSDASALLGQVRSRWLSQHASVDRDVVHMFTRRNLAGSTIGIAYLGGVCNSFGYGLVQSDCCGSVACSTDLSAHELGHNWNAGHCSCSGWTMNPSLTCANQFTAGTVITIMNFRNAIQSCLESLCQPSGGDVNDDGTVDVLDLLQVLADWGCEGLGECPSDTTCDGSVDVSDLLKVLANWD